MKIEVKHIQPAPRRVAVRREGRRRVKNSSTASAFFALGLMYSSMVCLNEVLGLVGFGIIAVVYLVDREFRRLF